MSYKGKIKILSEWLIEIQKPIRVLDAIKWPAHIAQELKASRYRRIPRLKEEDYKKVPLRFDPVHKLEELDSLSRSIATMLGPKDAIGNLLTSITEQYRDVVYLLLHRGTHKFWEYSRKLYGSPKDRFYDEKSNIAELGRLLASILSKIQDTTPGPAYTEDISAKRAVSLLNKRLTNYFHTDPVAVVLSDGIVADAAAGSDKVKIKKGAWFSKREIDILEVHEGWVHLGTTLSGIKQRYAKWLSKGPPRSTATQEGLAVMMEIFSFRTTPHRARVINNRILGIDKAEDGANVLELIEFYRTEGFNEDECITHAQRVFRGGVLEGGAPFTKDIVYCKGFVENYNFIRAAIRSGRPYLIPFLFVGKLNLEDVPLLYQKYQEGLVDPPRYLPPQFEDLNGLAVWMSFSSFLNRIDMEKIQGHYNKLFKAYL